MIMHSVEKKELPRKQNSSKKGSKFFTQKRSNKRKEKLNASILSYFQKKQYSNFSHSICKYDKKLMRKVYNEFKRQREQE